MATRANGRGYLRIPLRLQALGLDKEEDVVGAMADYRRLPYTNADGVDENAGTPNLSERVLASPFTRNLPLLPGIHLHWLLPEALAQGEQDDDGAHFPLVPNRWLVSRSGNDVAERHWVVESDYLYPEGDDGFDAEAKTPVNVLRVPDPAPGKGQRWRYLGRARSLDDWRKAPNEGEHARALTAAGPERDVRVLDSVRATFASFYPHCRTVFGFRDEELATRVPPAGLRYDVIGWYSDGEDDFLRRALADAATPELLAELLAERHDWAFPSGAPLPAATLYHGRVTFAPGARAARDVIAELPKPALAVGRTETEALGAYLAHVSSPETNPDHAARRALIEEQLEALQLTDQLAGHQLNLDALLHQARHERGFSSTDAGIRWSIQPKPEDNLEGARDLFASLQRRARGRRTWREPPPEWTRLLDGLNDAQEAYQRGVEALEWERQRMYVRWHALAARFDVKVVFFESYVVPVRHRMTELGRLALLENQETGSFRARIDPITFAIVSRDYTKIGDYFEVINAGVPFETKDKKKKSWYTWGCEWPNSCGFDLDPAHTVEVVERDKKWEITDRGVVYTAHADDAGLWLTIPPSATSLAGKLAAALDAMQAAVDAYNASEAGAASPHVLMAQPAAPYWEASDPVLLMTGPAASSPVWQGFEDDDGLLPCTYHDLTLDLQGLPTATIAALKGLLDGLGDDIGDTWREPPWNPFLMHWDVHVSTFKGDRDGAYGADYLDSHYRLDIQAVDQALKDNAESELSPVANTYQGMSLLTPSASIEIQDRVLYYLEQALLPDYYDKNSIPEDDRVDGYLAEHFPAVHEWYLKQTSSPDIDDPIFTALWAYAELEKTPCLAQAIGNFNQVLLCREPTMQLSIGDPIGFKDSQSFFYGYTAADAMGDSMQRQPLTSDVFNPLRAGAMAVTKLWLVDTFGQAKVVVDSATPSDVKVVTPTDQTPRSDSYHLLVPPRLAQPVRLRFEWLPGESSAGRRSNEHPRTNPVCGFLLVNNLDGALAVYDRDGRALGSVDRGGAWRTAPVAGRRVQLSARGTPQFANPHLEQVVQYVLGEGAGYLRQFLSAQRTALETIDPESYAECPSRALLVARPVAVVRASLRWELKGPPAFDPSAVADRDPKKEETTSRDFEKVQLAVRLGEYAQLDDGLVGFFRENDDGSYANDGLFYSPQLRGVNHPKIHTYENGSLQILKNATAPAENLTLLLDPRAQVHASSGLVPSGTLRIHPDYYARALADMEVSFLTAPLLTDVGALRLGVPEEPGHTWTWVTQEPSGSWSSLSELETPNPRASFSAPQELREGWLILRREEEGHE